MKFERCLRNASKTRSNRGYSSSRNRQLNKKALLWIWINVASSLEMNQYRGIGNISVGICPSWPTCPTSTSGKFCCELGKAVRIRFQNSPTCSDLKFGSGANCIPMDTSLMGGFLKSIFISVAHRRQNRYEASDRCRGFDTRLQAFNKDIFKTCQK